MKIEITKTDGKVYSQYCADQQDKIELKALLEDDISGRQEFVSAVVKYQNRTVKNIQSGNTEIIGPIVRIDSHDDLLAELGKFGG